MPRYKDKAMQGTYENALKVARSGGAELFMEDGRQRRAGSLSVAFWNGYNGQAPGIMEPAGSMARAAYMAGKTFRRERPDVQRPVGKPATGAAKVVFTARLSPERAAKARKLGVAWLEAAIDAA
jgi:hypothetical protein